MTAKTSLMMVAVLAAAGCTKTVVLKEKNPLMVSAAPPVKKQEAPPPPPPKVEVKKEKIQVNEKIHFEFNKAVIRPESFGLMDEIAKTIVEHKEILKLRIEGHTDNVGTHEYNLKLSKRRAKAVRDYLVKKGVDAGRLMTEGYAFDKPVADNDSEEGRAKNRRVEFNIVERAPDSGEGTPSKTEGADAAKPDAAKPDAAKPKGDATGKPAAPKTAPDKKPAQPKKEGAK